MRYSWRAGAVLSGRVMRVASLGALMALAACGTTYTLPEVTAASTGEAKSLFASEQARGGGRSSSTSAATARFQRVAARVKPAAVRFCQDQAVSGRTCDIPIRIDREMSERNAYHTRDESGSPYVAISLPLLRESRSDDEIAFVLSHEYGHHIANHLTKGKQQAIAGALVAGLLTAGMQSYASSVNPNRYTGGDAADLDRNVELGMAVGQQAYSQSYELESDVVATHITLAAGYDPVEGAKFFARAEDARTEGGKLSFWGTHPPDADRLATVIEAAKAARAGQGLVAKR